MSGTYDKIKKRNGERFAQTIRNHHNGILEIPDIEDILRYAGSDATPLLPYLTSLLIKDDTPKKKTSTPPEDPFVLLDRAGYHAFVADTLEKQNSISSLFKKSELLCTFNDAARYRNYYIVHAVKKNVDSIVRDDFNGKERREDAYGTSVISIQILKNGGFISIKNRYNHGVDNCDNTFNSNPDNIIDGLSAALKAYFKVDFAAEETALPEYFVRMGDKIVKYHTEDNNVYYGDGVWVKEGAVHEINKSAGDALFDFYRFDGKSKKLVPIDPKREDSFCDDFNAAYGGNRALIVKNGNLMLDGKTLIGTEQSCIKTVDLPKLTSMGKNCLCETSALTTFSAPALVSMGTNCLYETPMLTSFDAPMLKTMGSCCLHNASNLALFEPPALVTMEYGCLENAFDLSRFTAPALVSMGNNCLRNASALISFDAPMLRSMEKECLHNARTLASFSIPSLGLMKDGCLCNASSLTTITAPSLVSMGNDCLEKTSELTTFTAPALASIGTDCFRNATALTTVITPSLHSMGDCCFKNAYALTKFEAPALVSMGCDCLSNALDLHFFSTPMLTTMGAGCLQHATALTLFDAPNLTSVGDLCLQDAPALTTCTSPEFAKHRSPPPPPASKFINTEPKTDLIHPKIAPLKAIKAVLRKFGL